MCGFHSLFPQITEDEVQKYRAEYALTARIAAPNIVKLHGICVRPPDMCLVLELCEKGSLFHTLWRESRGRGRAQRLRAMVDAARAVAHLHGLGVIHRDLKSLNYLVTADDTIKLSDFGESRAVDKRDLMTNNGRIGTPFW